MKIVSTQPGSTVYYTTTYETTVPVTVSYENSDDAHLCDLLIVFQTTAVSTAPGKF